MKEEYPIEEILRINQQNGSSERLMELAVFELYTHLQVYYQSALDEVETKLQIINRELTLHIAEERENPIHQIQHRVKSFPSVVGKLEKKHRPFSERSIAKEVEDFAGVRVICPYTDDIYLIVRSLSR